MAYRPKIKNSDGTLTDLPLAAETTVKLKHSRSIGLSGVSATSRSFDGTSAITIPITAIPGSLLTGSTSINTSGNAASATVANKLSSDWQNLIPDETYLPYGVYIIRVDISHNVEGTGSYGSTITDVVAMFSDSGSVYEYRGYDYPSGGLHSYVSNNYEVPLYRTAKIKVTAKSMDGFRVDLFISQSAGYEQASLNITALHLYPTKQASIVSGVSYTMKYKQIA